MIENYFWLNDRQSKKADPYCHPIGMAYRIRMIAVSSAASSTTPLEYGPRNVRCNRYPRI